MSTDPTSGVTGATTRRRLFAGAGAFGAGALLVACGDGGGDGPGTPAAPPDDGAEQDSPLAEVSEVEVGGGFINAAEGVVVTQPAEGDFRGFSALCTHQGCTVADVSDGVIICPCHGSRYSIEDGAVVQSAPELTPESQDPLPAVEIAVEGSTIIRS